MSVEKLNELLPQTQCRECTFDGCKPYALALSKGEAKINLCPPGGVKTLRALGEALDIDPGPFEQDMANNTRPPAIARIREDECIGCTKCIQACPVDAIVGSNKFMHSVNEIECTGCRLCVEPCPVDCIDIIELARSDFSTELAQSRYEARLTRLDAQKKAKRQQYQDTRQLGDKNNDADAKKAYILEALARKQKQLKK